MNIQELGTSIKKVVDNKINSEARALRGTVKNGRFYSGGRSYPYKTAVDCNISSGNNVWAQLSRDGKAVIVGA